MLELFTFPFMQRALVGGIILSLLAGYYGVFVVQRKMSFLGSGLAHSAFGGVALGLLLGVSPLISTVPFTITVALLITWLSKKTKINNDTSIGILFSASVAIGMIFMALKEDYSADAISYLFGSILTIQATDLYAAGFVLLVSVLLIFKYWSRWAYASFDAELAQSDRIDVDKDDYLLSLMIALVVVVAIKLVGIMLVSAFLVIPAAAAKMVSKSFITMTIISVVTGVLSTIIGLVVSIISDLPSGATIVISQSLMFLTMYLLGRLKKF